MNPSHLPRMVCHFSFWSTPRACIHTVVLRERTSGLLYTMTFSTRLSNVRTREGWLAGCGDVCLLQLYGKVCYSRLCWIALNLIVHFVPGDLVPAILIVSLSQQWPFFAVHGLPSEKQPFYLPPPACKAMNWGVDALIQGLLPAQRGNLHWHLTEMKEMRLGTLTK